MSKTTTEGKGAEPMRKVTDFADEPADEGKILDCRYFIKDVSDHRYGFGGKYNGYVMFAERPVREPGYDGIITYVPVHGGITFAEQFEDGYVYGFDTAHNDSHEHPTSDLDWIRGQCEIMIKAIRVAVEVEPEYLLATDNEKKAEFAQRVLDVASGTKPSFGVMLNMLSGKV